ncbi:dimethyl sulfoxide reductase anchor subunit family protein [Austwickia chelonae]|uniref:dimethyl sulfoxide reductase anchor subunit family protein n=1 Tax=Austwickia chelonae TaxID=100225 RepID=UPI0013C32C6F|nr:DmsC/YnfH family molybdoenzyme membrane anchor subunit [Austwickia chelonae]
MTHELPLVAFTLIAQMSVGSFVVLGLIHLLNARVDPHVMDRVTDPALYAVGPLLVLGMGASTLHLGSPLRGINALRHLGTSWLSNEIAAGIVFLVLGAAFAAAQWFKVGTSRARQMLAGVTAGVGLFLVYCINRVYSLRTVPAWDTPYTLVDFFTTTLLLGALAVGTAMVVTARVRARRGEEKHAEDDELILVCLRGIALAAMALLAVKFVAQPVYLAYLGTHPDPAAARSLQVRGETYGAFAVLQYTAIVAGVAVLGYFLARLSRGPVAQKVLTGVVVSAFSLVFLGEVVGRMLFYASMVRTGL